MGKNCYRVLMKTAALSLAPGLQSPDCRGVVGKHWDRGDVLRGSLPALTL